MVIIQGYEYIVQQNSLELDKVKKRRSDSTNNEQQRKKNTHTVKPQVSFLTLPFQFYFQILRNWICSHENSWNAKR